MLRRYTDSSNVSDAHCCLYKLEVCSHLFCGILLNGCAGWGVQNAGVGLAASLVSNGSQLDMDPQDDIEANLQVSQKKRRHSTELAPFPRKVGFVSTDAAGEGRRVSWAPGPRKATARGRPC